MFDLQHSIQEEVTYVHGQLEAKYKFHRKAQSDIAKAKQMEKYLREFKAIVNQKKGQNDIIVGELEDQAIKNIAEQIGMSLGIDGYKLFHNLHGENYLLARSKGADDIFELELQQFLNLAIEEATQGQATGDASVVGQLPGNIAKGLLRQIEQKGLASIKQSTSDVITIPEQKSGKVDVVSFSGNFTYTADILPYWKKFIQTFKGAKFTVKNYNSWSKHETITLGNTDIRKSLLGTLYDIGNTQNEAVHIYEHMLYESQQQNNADVNQHLLHLRFAYELTGGGLYAGKDRLDSADFFIYNDSGTNNIYVRSTKEMIANMMDYIGNVADPLRSNVVILKHNF